MAHCLFTNIQVFDGTGTAPFVAEVLVRDQRIVDVARAPGALPREGVQVIDGRGATLMPGLIDAHTHLGFGATVDNRFNWRQLRPEQQRLAAAEAARTLLDFGYTSAYSGGAVDARWEVTLRDEFAAGRMPGPRLKACSFERQASAVNGTPTTYAGAGQRAPDAAGVRQFVREMADIGVDSVKFLLTGESAVRPGTSRTLQFHEEEIAAGAEEAQAAGVWLNGHCHSAEAVKLAVRYGFRAIYHCTWSDEEAIDALVAAKDRVFVAPGPGVNYAAIHEAQDFGITPEMAAEQEQPETLARVSRLMPELQRRGVRVLPGGDYGFAWNPIGRNARDMELFVSHFGFTASEALRGATQFGGQLMGMGHELGLIRADYLADLLLVDGDPTRNVGLLLDRNRLLFIMKDGKFHKSLRP